jgi:hypothetical protein
VRLIRDHHQDEIGQRGVRTYIGRCHLDGKWLVVREIVDIDESWIVKNIKEGELKEGESFSLNTFFSFIK